MQFLSSLLRSITIGMLITCVAIFSSSGQTKQPETMQANIIDTNAMPVAFAPGVVSTPYTEWATSFTPNGNTVYFSQGAVYWTICFSKKVNGKWIKPEVANISGKWNDTDPFISPDGKRMFFISNRPLAGMPQDKAQKHFHLWYADHLSGNEWAAPHHIDGLVNIDTVNNYAPSISKNGTLFFCSRGRGGNAGMASYSAKWLGDHFAQPQLLALKGKDDTQDPFIAPDESYILFLSGNDIYISYRQGNEWSPAQNLGKQVNNGDSNSSPAISPDGKMLYYSSGRVKGLYKRDPKGKPLSYDQLVTEMQSAFNGDDNILMIPVNLPKPANQM